MVKIPKFGNEKILYKKCDLIFEHSIYDDKTKLVTIEQLEDIEINMYVDLNTVKSKDKNII